MVIDFNEIPTANLGSGNQDVFELFARDFLEALGYEIISNPGRGADNGKDLIVQEVRKGVSDQLTLIKWLVSCKHYARSKKSITPSIEQNINDRVRSNDCDGFIGFYSTVPSEGLNTILTNVIFQIFDREKIESNIIGNEALENIFKRYFPKSYEKWKAQSGFYVPIRLFDYYLKTAHEFGLEIFKSIFKTSGSIFVAVSNSSSVEEFLMFRNVRIKKIDIDLETDRIHEEYYDEIKNLPFTEQLHFHPKVIVKETLQLEAFHEIEIIQIGFSTRNHRSGRYILCPTILIINEVEFNQIVSDFNDLKMILKP